MTLVQKTFGFTTDSEGLADQGVSAVAFSHDALDGNLPGCVKFAFGTKATTATERAKTSALAWTDYGVPAGSTVNSVRVVSYDRKVAAVSKLSSHSHAIRVGGVTLASETLPTSTGAWIAGGGLSPATSPSDPQLELEYTVTTLGGGGTASVDARFDKIVVEVDYSAAAVAISGSGGVSFGFLTSGTGTVIAPSYTGSGGVAFGFSTSGSGTYTAPATPEVTGSGGVAFGFATSGTGMSVAPSFTGSGGVSFGFAVDGTGTVVAPGVSGSGSVAFGFSTSGTGTYTAPVGPAAITGSGGVSFGFSTSGVGTYVGTAPPDDPPSSSRHAVIRVTSMQMDGWHYPLYDRPTE